MLIVVFGLPGTGKSYFAKALAKSLGARHINSDVVRKETREQTGYTEEAKLEVYERMFDMALEDLRQGNAVVLDATFYRAELRERIIRLTSFLRQRPVFIRITADEELIRERTNKPREHSEADFKVYHIIKSEFEPMEEEHLVLESGRDNLDEMLEEARQYISNIHAA